MKFNSGFSFQYNETALSKFVFIPVFLSLYLLFFFFRDSVHLLQSFDGRPVSVATSEAIDITARVSSFYKAFLLLILFLFSFTWLTLRVKKILNEDELEVFNSLAAAGIILLFFKLTGSETNSTLHLIIVLAITYATGLFIKSRRKIKDAEAGFNLLFVWISSLSFSLYFFQRQLFSLVHHTGFQSLPLFLLVVSCALFTGLLLFVDSKNIESSILQKRIHISAPLALFPLLSVLVTEAYMILNQHDVHGISIILIYSFSLFALLLWMWIRSRKQNLLAENRDFSPVHSLGKFWLPAFCAGIAALAFYQPIVAVNIDWFEDANHVLPLQQFREFGKIPFLDTFSSHALSDFAPGALYSFLNGYDALGGFVYQFIISIFITLVIYYFTYRITGNSLMAFFLAVFYPYVDFIIPSYYNFVPLTILALLNIYRNQSRSSYFLFFLVILFMIFWRIDLGMANLIAAIGALLALCFLTPGFRPERAKLLKGLLTLLIPALGIILLVLLFYSGNVWLRISEVLGYISSFQSYGLKDLSYTQDLKYFSLYYFMPVLVLFACIHAVIRLLRNREGNRPTTILALSLIFLSLFYFANFQRGMVRHTLAEQWDEALTSYGFFILAAGIFFNRRFSNRKSILFFLFLAVSTLIVANYKFSTPDLTQGNLYSAAGINFHRELFPSSTNVKTDRTPEAESRNKMYDELDAFLKSNFPDSSTFLDFSNSPMLYYYLNRVTPDYFCQIPHTAHSDKMQEYLLQGLSEYDIPIVIFSNVPNNFWDYLDGIPNTLRHYRIAEYIYKNYSPFAIMDQHSVWLRKNSSLSINKPELEISTKALSDLEIYGGEWSDSTKLRNRKGESLRVQNVLKAPLEMDDSLHYYFKVSYKSSTPGTLKIFSRFSQDNNTENLQSEFKIYPGHSESFIIPESHGNFRTLSSIGLQVSGTESIEINSIKLAACETVPDLIDDLAPEYQLKWIPYVWGNYDKEPTTELQASLLKQPALHKADQVLYLTMEGKIDKEKGNYIHIAARATGDKPLDVLMNYGSGEKRSGGFIFRVSPDSVHTDYKIRISSQYNWIAKNAEWITFYPMGGDVMFNAIEVLKGD